MTKWILTATLLLVSGVVHAATIQANSPSRVDVGAAVGSAVTGDTVLVPAGLAVWTSSLSIINKGIKLQGAGTNATIIVDENPTSRVNQPSLIDIIWQGTNGGMFELTGFQFRGGTNQTTTLITGAIRIVASNNMTNDSVWRIHGNLWSKIWGRPMQVRAWSGLIDQNYFDLIQGQSGMAVDNRIVASEQGDRAWNRAAPAGTTNLVYIEHNQIICPGGSKALVDGFAGSRYVVRYNSILNRSAENHGTESTQRARSGRWMEIYGNTFTHTGGASGEYCVLFRGGSGLVFSNSVVGSWPGFLKMVYFLSLESHAPWNAANGTNVWDLNVAGGPFETGTHTGPNGSANLVDASKSWTVDQWQQYSVIDYSQTFTNAGSVQNFSGLIAANTSTTITIDPPQPTIEQWTWNTGDIYKLWRVDIGLDAPGRGAGALLSGGNSTTPPTPTTWPGEIDEPIHYWANTGVSTVASGLYPIVAGRDYTNSPLAGYVPLVDPHPLAGGTNTPPPPPLPATMLAFNQQPTTAVESTVITPPVTVYVLNDNGQIVTTSSALVTISITTNPGGGTLAGILSVAATSGVATFSDLSINNAGAGYRLSVTSPGLAGRTSASFDITAAILPASQLVLAQQPSNALTNAVISPSITVKLADANGAQTTSTANVTVSIGTNPGGGTLSGTLTRAAVSGLAMFDDLRIDNAGTNYTLSFASAGLTSATSEQFNIYVITPPPPPPAVKLAFGVQPSTSVQSTTITPPVTVLVQDTNSQIVASSTASVTLAIASNPASGTLSGTLTHAAVNGVATFNGLSIDNVGVGYTLLATSSSLSSATSATFDITSSVAPSAQLIVAQQPSDTLPTSVISPSVTVKITDTNGVQTTSTANVTVSMGANPGGGALSGTLTRAAVSGLATFNDLSINNYGTNYTLNFVSGALTGTNSTPFNIYIVTPPVPPVIVKRPPADLRILL